jgi:hypothetical protein
MTVDLKRENWQMHLMPPSPITQSWVSLWQYRYTRFTMGQQGRTLSHGVAAIIFVADDTVESLSFTGFHYQEGSYGIEDGKSFYLLVPLSWQVSS